MGKKSCGLKVFIMISTIVVVASLVCWLMWPEPPVKPIDIDSEEIPSEFQPVASVMKVAATNPPQYEVTADVSVAPVMSSKKVAAARPISQPQGYNLERTWRIIRALELAEKSTDLSSFLKHLAQQDYTGVPAEVIDAQRKVLPIISRLREVEASFAENEQAMSTLGLLREGIAGVGNRLDSESENGASQAAVELGMRMFASVNPMELASEAMKFCKENEKALAAGVSAAAAAYNLSKSRQKELERELKEVQCAYVQFMMAYSPIRHKYEKEWDALCLDKDRAYVELGKRDYGRLGETTAGILSRYPYDREAILLRAFALSRLAISEAMESDAQKAGRRPVQEIRLHSSEVALGDSPKIKEAIGLVDSYISTYPGTAAPALVMKGLVLTAVGDRDGALEAFDLASTEYPREASRLNDILESYSTRPFLEKTAEGLALLRLHRSLAEGFGAFSPNLEKAFLYERQGDYQKAREEIFNHFFRRSNQEVYHELFMDMQFCEEHLSVGFKGLLLEHAFFDVSIAQPSNWYLTKKKDVIDVSLKNRTDFALKNVRVFLCVQFAGMYKGAYDVINAGAIGQLAAGAAYEFNSVGLGREGVEYKDIANVRAIVMTDDRICWVDSVETKRAHAANVMSGLVNPDLPFTISQYLSAFGTGSVQLENMLKSCEIRFKRRTLMPTDTLEISIPRIFMILDPVFTIGEAGTRTCLYPSDNRVEGTSIVIRFDVKVKEGETLDFCVYSDFLNFKLPLLRKEDTVSIQGLRQIFPQKRN